MAAKALHIKHGWIWICAIFIFFFNTFLLPEGVTYVLLLMPVWLYILYQQQRLAVVPAILIPLAVFAVIHLVQGVDVIFYFRSLIMITGIIVFLAASYSYFNKTSVNWDLIFRDIAILNFIFTLIALCLLFFPSVSSVMWYKVPVTQNITLPRLKLFTEEASHYSFIFAPVAIYFYSRVIFFKTSRSFLTLFIVTLPLLLSFSLGVLSGIVLSCIVALAVYSNRIFFSSGRKWWLAAIVTVIGALFLLAYKVDPGNILYTRIHNIFTGDDTSARGRTYEAFILANKIIAQKSFLWGIGPGQLKLIGRDIIVQYYHYSNAPQVIRIPNASAETIACFGYVGLGIRLLAELALFFITKVYKNPYRLWLFVFVFIYQFTGSYITNVAEYLVWLLAFSSIFPEYEWQQTGALLKTKKA